MKKRSMALPRETVRSMRVPVLRRKNAKYPAANALAMPTKGAVLGGKCLLACDMSLEQYAKGELLNCQQTFSLCKRLFIATDAFKKDMPHLA